MRGCTSSLLPVVQRRKTTKQTDKNWETSLTTAVLQSKTRRCVNNLCLICPHNNRFGREPRTPERHETTITTANYTRLACALLYYQTRSERDPTNLQSTEREQNTVDHHFQDVLRGVRDMVLQNTLHTDEPPHHTTQGFPKDR